MIGIVAGCIVMATGVGLGLLMAFAPDAGSSTEPVTAGPEDGMGAWYSTPEEEQS